MGGPPERKPRVMRPGRGLGRTAFRYYNCDGMFIFRHETPATPERVEMMDIWDAAERKWVPVADAGISLHVIWFGMPITLNDLTRLGVGDENANG